MLYFFGSLVIRVRLVWWTDEEQIDYSSLEEQLLKAEREIEQAEELPF